MKKYIFSWALLLIVHVATSQNNDRYMGAMGASLQQFATAKSQTEMNELAARFQRIGEAEKTQWLPYYYAAMIKAQMAMGNAKQADALAAEADALIAKAAAIEDNAELDCVRNMATTARMLVDPMNRWQQYGPIAAGFLQDAMKKDPTNPRPYMLQAASLINTPEQFGGGCKTAKPLAEKAIQLYESFKSPSSLHPNWGKETVIGIVQQCK
ncbi:MAG: hypothetical protein MH132_13320 [Hydrotalea sp.]|jgi:hypothetical protein|nr:hypothetical protein [Hydrotalea sp.]